MCIPANIFDKGYIDIKCPLAPCKKNASDEKICDDDPDYLKSHGISTETGNMEYHI